MLSLYLLVRSYYLSDSVSHRSAHPFDFRADRIVGPTAIFSLTLYVFQMMYIWIKVQSRDDALGRPRKRCRGRAACRCPAVRVDCADLGGWLQDQEPRGRPDSYQLEFELETGYHRVGESWRAYTGNNRGVRRPLPGGFSASPSRNPSRKGVEKLEGLHELVLGDVARPECGPGGKGW